MGDIVLVEGQNELNVSLEPVLPDARIVSPDWYTGQPFPPGQRQRVTITMQNLASYPYPYTLVVYDDSALIGYTPVEIGFGANQTKEHTIQFMVGGTGTHYLTARLYYGDTRLDEETISYSVTEVEAAKDGDIGEWIIWHESLDYWETFSMV